MNSLITAAALIAGLVLVQGCDARSTSNPLGGTWAAAGMGGCTAPARYRFSHDQFTIHNGFTKRVLGTDLSVTQERDMIHLSFTNLIGKDAGKRLHWWMQLNEAGLIIPRSWSYDSTQSLISFKPGEIETFTLVRCR